MTFDTSFFLIIGAILVAVIAAYFLLRPRKRAAPQEKSDEPYIASSERPYMKTAKTDGVPDEFAAATTDIAGELLSVDAHAALSGTSESADDLQLLKGVGPKFVALLHEFGVTRFQQLAEFSETELAHLDERLGPFRGRLVRDRVAEQAAYLARGDFDGFEEKFGKLGG